MNLWEAVHKQPGSKSWKAKSRDISDCGGAQLHPRDSGTERTLQRTDKALQNTYTHIHSAFIILQQNLKRYSSLKKNSYFQNTSMKKANADWGDKSILYQKFLC